MIKKLYYHIFIIIVAIYCVRNNQIEGLLICGILSFIFYIYLGLKESKEEYYLISPLVIYLFLSSLYVGIAPIWAYICLKKNYNYIFDIGFFNVSTEILHSQNLCLLGVLSFYIGYKLGKKNKVLINIKKNLSKLKWKNINMLHLLFIALLSWSARIFGNFNDKIKNLGAIYEYISESSKVAIFLIVANEELYLGRKNIKVCGKKKMIIAIGALLIELLINFYFIKKGMRHYISDPIVMFIFGLLIKNKNYIRGKVNNYYKIKKILFILIIFAISLSFFIIVLFPFGKQYLKEGTIPRFDEIKFNIINIEKTFPNEGLWTVPYRAAISSMIALGAVKIAREYYLPENKVIKSVFVGIIPRFIWKEKPYITKGAWFSVFLNIGRGVDERTATTSTGMTAIGEIYWSYGLLGMILGMGLIGFLYSVTYEIVSARFFLHPIKGIATGLMLVSILRWLEGDASSIIIFVWHMWLVIILTLFLSNFRSKIERTIK